MIRQIIILISISLILSCSSNEKNESITNSFEELIQKTPTQLRILRNEIFAKHGYIFKSEDLKNHFNSKDWYEPKYNSVDSFLTDFDRERIELILKAEKYLKTQRLINEIFKQKSDTLIGKMHLPLTISSIIEAFDKPDSSYIDNDEFCPIGQLHFWNFNDFNFQLMVLGDNYDNNIDYSANSRLFAVKLINENNISEFPGLFNIKLGDLEKEVDKKLQEYLTVNKTFKLETFEHETVVDRFLIDKIKNVYWITNDNVYFHFVINSNGRLEYILQSNFNIRGAC